MKMIPIELFEPARPGQRRRGGGSKVERPGYWSCGSRARGFVTFGAYELLPQRVGKRMHRALTDELSVYRNRTKGLRAAGLWGKCEMRAEPLIQGGGGVPRARY